MKTDAHGPADRARWMFGTSRGNLVLSERFPADPVFEIPGPPDPDC